MDALKVDTEPQQTKDSYGNTSFGRSVLMARRLIQVGVPFVEVGFGGWDLHQMTHETLKDNKLPELDKAISALIVDLKRLDMWENTAIIMMGEFGRTPRINQDAGRDHWAMSWSAFVSGGLFKNGQVIGSTSEDGTQPQGLIYQASDLMATVCSALDIDTSKDYTSKNGRPMRIANGGNAIKELV
jgi:uncharacterized protein (DUF1501 family)